jgi:folate-binding protein YgfZ
VLAAGASDLPAAGVVLHVPAAAEAEIRTALEAAGAVPVGRETLDVLRIEDGVPWFGPDVTEANLLHETGLVAQYHSPTKGCYVGQEVIARLEARGGNVNKGLRGLRLRAPATPGDAIRAGGADVGRVTTAGVSPRLGPIALGYVHRSRFEPGTEVEVGGAVATVTALPMAATAEPAGPLTPAAGGE